MSAVEIVDQKLIDGVQDLAVEDQSNNDNCTAAVEETNPVVCETNSSEMNNHHGVCAICLNKIVLQETALVKGCEHAYCIHDYMFEESVCLLLRASWFKPLVVVEREEAVYEEIEEYYYEDEEEDMDDDVYLGSSSSLRIGNRRWGDNGYVRAGRQEARPVYRPNPQDSAAGPSHRTEKKDTKETVGRRAKRALKREAANKAAAVKHQQHLARLGRVQV
ncbi:hypothetical protein C2S51_013270 [Perilla frutescens var. frutescens]|nr:hypothetical protein C2S51_013270 [Perilla frutescens var. frutescens]